MPNWGDVLAELQELQKTFQPGNPHPLDLVRRKYLKMMSDATGRNVIAYYSGFLQRPGVRTCQIDDNDKNAFMATIHKLDRSKGLDLILHTPGGDLAATESLVDYIRAMFKTDVVAYIPQIAMSAGTMIACSCKEIVMGDHSNLGPIDPQFNGIPAHGVIEEFKSAIKAVKKDPASLPLWQTIISRYHPTFIGECQKSIRWSEQMVTDWLETGMLHGQPGARKKAAKIVKGLSDHKTTKSHARHMTMRQVADLGLVIKDLKLSPNNLQDTVLTVHHAFMHTFANSVAAKIVENQNGVAVILNSKVTGN